MTPMFDISLGMDPDSTGYENIILRGALYGTVEERKFCGGWMRSPSSPSSATSSTLPVRTYSLGMHARLTFAMATCVVPEILLLDEGIAAGDASFLDKANQRLQEFMHATGILVFATHAEYLIEEFCNKVMMMEHGRLVWIGDVKEGIARYHEAAQQAAAA